MTTKRSPRSEESLSSKRYRANRKTIRYQYRIQGPTFPVKIIRHSQSP